MKKWRLLPKLAWMGVVKNGTVYFPYMVACVFSVFTFFIFSSILQNDLISTLPKSQYAWIMLEIGRVLLGFILLPFLYYANSFLIKRRKKEIGLYSILGLEKKHIGTMLLLEGIGIYVVTVALGIVCGIVLAKLLFLLLLKMTGLPVSAAFTFSVKAFLQTMSFFGVVFAMNLLENLIQVSKTKPIVLLSDGKKGEKEPKLLWLYAVFGLAVLIWGYQISITAQVDSMVFINFLLAILLVVIGTYFLFTSGSIAFLRILKKKKQTYYSPAHFITISGMLYRMKKNAASLVNICIFSTMVIITLLCTTGLFYGLPGILKFMTPYDIEIRNQGNQPAQEAVTEELAALSEKYGVETDRLIFYDEISVWCMLDQNELRQKDGTSLNYENVSVQFMTLKDYNKMEGEAKTLSGDEIIVYTSGANLESKELLFMGKKLAVKEELDDLYILPKAGRDVYGRTVLIVVADETVRAECLKIWGQINGVEDMEAFVNNTTHKIQLNLAGEEKAVEVYCAKLKEWAGSQPGFVLFDNAQVLREETTSMYGGLLFIGILFSIIFFMCLILIMYYKQISEGYEDRDSFAIMQKVGMSDEEIKRTVRKQILLVFELPLLGAFCHTAAGLPFVLALFGTLNMFDQKLIVTCGVVMAIVFALFYGFSYQVTAKTYYRIVRQSNQNA